jgi:hypothetical protein
MQVKIYQSYYNFDNVPFLDPDFIPLNNFKNSAPELREYPLFKQLYEENKEFGGHWGLSSWRWHQKTGLTGSKFINWIKSNPGFDVHHFSHQAATPIKFNNLFVQGDEFHPGMIDYTNLLLKKLGHKFKIEKTRFPPNLFMASHYHIGNNRFWKDWIDFLENSLEISRNDKKLNDYLYVKTCEHRGQNLINFCFVVERLVSLFLYLNQDKFKVLEYHNYVYK